MLALTLLAACIVNAEPTLDEGRELFRALKYEEALSKLEQAIEAPNLATAERREAFDLLARTWAALGNLPRAQAVYGQLLLHDPNAPAPDDAAPKIREAFHAAKLALFPAGTVRLSRRRASEGLLRFELFDPWSAVTQLELYDASTGAPIQSVTVRPLGEARVASGVTGVWLEAFDANHEVIATLGRRDKPLRLARAAAPHAIPHSAPADVAADEEDVADAPTDAPLAAAEAKPTLEPKPTVVAPPTSWRVPVAIGTAGLALATTALGAVLGLVAQQDAATVTAPPASLSQRAAFELAGRQRGEATAANVMVGVAVSAAIATVIVLMLGPRSP